MYIVGIDIAKFSHQGIIISKESGEVLCKSFKFQNSHEGLDVLLQKIREVSSVMSDFEIGMEATGHYWLNLYTHLLEKGFTIHVINPLQSDALRNLYLRKQKTDSIDAKIIAQVIRFGQYSETKLKDGNILAIRELCRQRFYLVDKGADLKRKIGVMMDKIFPEYKSIFSDMFGKSSIALLKKYTTPKEFLQAETFKIVQIIKTASCGKLGERKAMEIKMTAQNSFYSLLDSQNYSVMIKQMVEQIELNEFHIFQLEKIIQKNFEPFNSKITQIPGIGEVLGASILSEIGDINRFSSIKKLVAYAGIDPSVRQSGEFLGTENHMSKRGSPYLRRALWIAAFVTVNHNESIIRLYNRRKSTGKSHFQIMGFVCHKLLNIIYSILKNNEDYNYVEYENQQWTNLLSS